MTQATTANPLSSATYIHLFPAPFMAHTWSDAAKFNDELRECIFAHEKQTRGENRSNEGGWHSETGQLEFLGNAGRRLTQYMYELVNEATRRILLEYRVPSQPLQWSFAAWANICRAGDFHSTHTHPGATWSGVYYVDTGTSGNQAHAPLQLIDPCQGRANTFLPLIVPSSMHVRPEAGLMVLFPSYLGHMVYAHKGDKPRVSIAFNLRKEPYP